MLHVLVCLEDEGVDGVVVLKLLGNEGERLGEGVQGLFGATGLEFVLGAGDELEKLRVDLCDALFELVHTLRSDHPIVLAVSNLLHCLRGGFSHVNHIAPLHPVEVTHNIAYLSTHTRFIALCLLSDNPHSLPDLLHLLPQPLHLLLTPLLPILLHHTLYPSLLPLPPLTHHPTNGDELRRDE